MNDSVKIILDSQEYELLYNEQTGYYEITLNSPQETGLHTINVVFSADDDIAIDECDLIVLKKEVPENISDEIVGYFLDQKTFEIVDVDQIVINEINIDLETNGNSIFNCFKHLNIKKGDIIYLKKNDANHFIGIVESQEKNSNDDLYTITCKYILSLFDVQVFKENDEIISTTGIEDFLKTMIVNEFINNSDSFVNRNYLTVEALTHNKKTIQIENIVTVNNDVYNFLTFINNCIKNYDLKFDFILTNEKLKIVIGTKTDESIMIDATTTDIIDYTEVYALSYTAKVEVLIKENNTKYYRYLLNDRTTTTNQNDVKRVFGKVQKTVVEKTEDAEQTALDIFKGNSYEHNITFTIRKDSKLMNVKNIKIGQPILIKTKNNILQDTYISKIVDNNSNYITLTCGNIRINYIDKFLKERRQ